MSKGSQEDIWVNRPAPKECTIPWKDPPAPQNPVVRGALLHYGALAISKLSFVQSVLWQNAGFNVLRDRPELEDWEPRYDPLVVKMERGGVRSGDALVTALSGEDWTAKKQNVRVHRSVLDFHEAYRTGRVTPTDVAKVLLHQLRKGGRHAVAFLQIREDLVLDAAAKSTERYRNGKPLSIIDGVPVAVKDEVDVSGYNKCYGSKIDFTRTDDATSFCVEKWQEAGAVLIGKTLMHELGADTTNNNANYGTPRNPNNEEYYCGGSSGGSAYTVAAGLMPLCEGNDGGGSIRIPASYCGLYGLKTSHGRVSKRPSLNLAKSTGVCGPMAASMLDLEIGYRIMAQPDALDPDSALFSPPKPISLSQPRHKNKLLGIYQPWIDRAEPLVKQSFQAAITWLTTQRNYTVVPITLPLLHEAQLSHALTILSELCTGISPAQQAHLTAPNKVLLSVARHTTSIDLLQAQRLRSLLLSHLSHLFALHSRSITNTTTTTSLIIATPTTPNPGWPIHPSDLTHGVTNGNMSIHNMTYAFLANFSGCPALTAPCGFVDPAQGHGRVPVGMMGMAEWCAEDVLLEFGYDMERYVAEELEGGRPKPGNWVDVLGLAEAVSVSDGR